MMNYIGRNPFMDLKESIDFVHERDQKRIGEFPNDCIESLDNTLLDLYKESKLVSLKYRERNKVYTFTGLIERIDLIYKTIYLLPKKKIAFCNIIGVRPL